MLVNAKRHTENGQGQLEIERGVEVQLETIGGGAHTVYTRDWRREVKSQLALARGSPRATLLGLLQA